jgi:CHAD domain-containing protein
MSIEAVSAAEPPPLKAGPPKFALRTGEPLAAGLRRVALEQHRWAQLCLSELTEEVPPNPDLAVHELRKVTKRLRAWLRLVRGCAPKSWCREVNDRLRRISADFSGVRDAWVQHETLVHMTSITPEAEDLLKAELDQARRNMDLRALALGWREQWHDLLAEVEAVPLDDSLEACLAKNLRRTLKRARKAWRLALSAGSGDAYHETRKPVKRLWYHACLLKVTDENLWTELEPALDEWADALGSDHDLHMLQTDLEGKGSPLTSRAEWKQIVRETRERHKQLRKKMMPHAEAVLRWKPKALEQRALDGLTKWAREQEAP